MFSVFGQRGRTGEREMGQMANYLVKANAFDAKTGDSQNLDDMVLSGDSVDEIKDALSGRAEIGREFYGVNVQVVSVEETDRPADGTAAEYKATNDEIALTLAMQAMLASLS